MEEKKKRFRPTLTQYRALEKEFSEAKEKLIELSSKNKTLELSNDFIYKEMIRLRNHTIKLSNELVNRYKEIWKLKTRGFWSRMFNKNE